MRIECKEFNNVEEVELHFFKELDILYLKPVDEEIENKFNDLFSGYRKDFNFLIVLKVINNEVICCNDEKFYMFNNLLNLNEGEIIFRKNYEYNLFKIDKNILNKEFLEECLEKLGNNHLEEDDEIKKDILTKKDIEERIEKVITETEFEKQQRLKEKQEEKEKENEDYERKKKYEEESILKEGGNDIKVNKNKIEIGTVKFILTKNANELFDYYFLNSYYTSSDEIKEKLIGKEEGFSFYINDKKIYDLKYEINKKEAIIKNLEEKRYYSKVKINGVRIRRDKVKFILNRINKDTTKKEIELMKKLSGIQLELLKLNKIYVKEIPIEIKFSVTNIKDRFLVELFGKQKGVNWGTIRNCFAYGRSIHQYPSLTKFLIFIGTLGFTKQEIYDKMKELKAKDED